MLGGEGLFYCTVDEYAHQLPYKTFFYVDLPTGLHTITMGGVSHSWSGLPAYYGKTLMNVELGNREVVYVRIDAINVVLRTRFAKHTPTNVDAKIGEQEIQTLIYAVKHKTGIKVKKK